MSRLTFSFTAHKLEKLIKLEAEYGQAPSFDPAIDVVLEYLKPVSCYLMYSN